MHVGPMLSSLIVPHVAKNPKSGTKRSHRRWTVELPPDRQVLDRGSTLAAPGFSALRKESPCKRVKRSKISYPLDRKAATIAAIKSQSEVAVKPRHPDPAVAAVVWCVAFFALVPSMCAQEAAVPRHTGVPQDWSQHHIVFSRDALALHPNLIDREPRVLHQVMQRWQAPNSNVFHGVDPVPTAANNSSPHRDWSVSPLGGHLMVDAFPAKFSFDAGAPPDCTNDYVVFGLQSVGVNGAAANLVAFNNLYVNNTGTGFCSGK